MKGAITVKLNQATMVEAMQQYFDTQLAKPHMVKIVRRTSETVGIDSFEVELEGAQSNDVG
jgi:hypothetical protein